MPRKIVKHSSTYEADHSKSKNFLMIKPKLCCPDYVSFHRLKGKNAVITSAQDRVGMAVAIAFAKEGANLILIYHHAKYEKSMLDLSNYLKSFGVQVTLIKSSTFDEYKCKKLFQQIFKKVGSIDLLINNFPINNKPEDNDSHYLLKKTDTLKIQSLFILGKICDEYMSNNGVVINTTSICAYSQPDQLVFYSAMKAAVKEYTKELHTMFEYYDKKLRVNGITTGFIWSDLIPEVLEDYETLPLHFKSLQPRHPYEIAPLFVFLASNESTIISGETLNATTKK